MHRLFFIFFIIISLISAQIKDEKREEYIKAVRSKIEEIKAKIPNIKNPVKEYLQIAHLYVDIEDYENAIVYFNNALNYDPQNPNIYYMLAMIYEKKDEKIKAIQCWENVIKHSKNKKITEIAQKHIEILKTSK